MKPLSQYIKELPDIELPQGLHERIMEKARLQKLRFRFSIIIYIITINFFITAWIVWMKISETNFTSVLQSLADGFEMNTGYFLDFIKTIAQFVPTEHVVILIINLVAVLYLASMWKKINKIIIHFD